MPLECHSNATENATEKAPITLAPYGSCYFNATETLLSKTSNDYKTL